MARVVVVGGGLGGSASAARLAKQGHSVTLLERLDRVGGALGYVELGGYRWDSGPVSTALPAVLRDLFRKFGRALDRELELVPLTPIREHRFEDGSVSSSSTLPPHRSAISRVCTLSASWMAVRSDQLQHDRHQQGPERPGRRLDRVGVAQVDP